MEIIPRSILAQKMDALSSQANLAGYAAVIIAADRMRKILPMMMTPAGTISPARFFIIGVGVAGLQAIATAKRLGAKFVKVDLGDTGQTDQGYAKELPPEQLDKHRQEMAKACARADVVITTAKLFGRKAPLILNQEVLQQMQPGIIQAHKVRTTFCLKRGKGAGFSGLENALFSAPNSRMLCGDAKATVTGLIAQFKNS
jgi:NAD(P) transhydrogenase subunit alpha